MGSGLRLVIFDMDGTLVDSQADILSAMAEAFDGVGLAVPPQDEVLGIVGLSLDMAMSRLAPDVGERKLQDMVQGYKDAYVALRAQSGAAQSSPMYPGARNVLDRLRQAPDTLLGVATGKSRRGLDKLIEAHGLDRVFVTQQVADHHPSKPHPSMVRQAMAETGVAPEDTVMIGDTSFDMQMARSAGVHAIGVSWGYHPVSALADASHMLDSFDELPEVLSMIWSARP